MCAGHIEDIVSHLIECKELLKKLKSDSTPNPIVFLLESQHIISNINSKCGLFLKTSKTVSQHIVLFVLCFLKELEKCFRILLG